MPQQSTSQKRIHCLLKYYKLPYEYQSTSDLVYEYFCTEQPLHVASSFLLQTQADIYKAQEMSSIVKSPYTLTQ